ncbi:MAG: phosphate acyltransferase PlsX [Candidatus Eisenbacteria bacterium]|nr:phosphate acyltransferase PlsX [Candidatus Eisenbacteria bacterium]
MSTTVTVGVDAMGGDLGPRPVVEGAVDAARMMGDDVRLALVGDRSEIQAELARLRATHLPLSVIHASDRVAMDEDPLRAVRRKRDSSLNLLARMQARGEIQAMISPGSTGAVVASAQVALGKLEGVSRPAIASFLPTLHGSSVVVDVGASPDCRPLNLLQFAIMGSLYASLVLRLPRPRVGLLSIGEEREKGNELSRAAHRLLERSGLNFIGNLEGRDVLQGKADVLVCDGFVGNVVLKVTEGAMAFFANRVRREMRGSIAARLGSWLLKPSLLRLRRSLDPEELGGAPLLGLNGICIVAHGRSGSLAIRNAITMAVRCARQGVNEHIRVQLAAIPEWVRVERPEAAPCV